MTPAEGGSSHVQENLNEYENFSGMLHNLFPMYDMAPKPMDEGPSMQQLIKGPNNDTKRFYKMTEDVEKPI